MCASSAGQTMKPQRGNKSANLRYVRRRPPNVKKYFIVVN
jgi:hypothetical protein